ncbi:hypothetical protein [Aeromonas veronii]|uniref:hypothetical protein n=1 Tax=Aeromonas veronii TaxID=654 RepID=UPI003B9E1B03
MKGLQFQRLILVSDSKKLANQFEFPKRLNLITGKDNSIGKSTLVKNIFWALGCEPALDEEWKSNDVKALLHFSIDGVNHYVARHQNIIVLDSIRYNSIGGDYSEALAQLVKFKLKLPNRDDDTELQTPPPAFYFLPFYIDQRKSWNEPWESFEKLGQYKNWKSTVVKYHSGYIGQEHFEIEENICEQKRIENIANNKIQRIDSAVEILEEVSTKTNIAISKEEFDSIQKEIQEDLNQFVTTQSRLLETQTILKNEIYDLEKQLELAINSVYELEEDYSFAVECVSSDILECPLCGTNHDNSLASRAVLLADKNAVLEQAHSIEHEITSKKHQLHEVNYQLREIKDEVIRINKKYIAPDNSQKEEPSVFSRVLSNIAKNNVAHKVYQSKDAQKLIATNAKENQREFKKDQRKLLPHSTKKELSELFMGNLLENIKVLGAEGLNLSKVKHPTDYNKLMGGGAAEGTRGLLAYQLAILRQSDFVQNCVTAPFVVDTPNQQEQAVHRYDKVVEVIMSNVPKTTQIIMCGMENPSLDVFSSEAHVIELDGHRLLREDFYDECSFELALTVNI